MTANTLSKLSRPQAGSLRRDRAAGNLVTYLLLFAGSAVMLLPLAWMVTTAFKQTFEVFMFPPRWIPERLVWENFTQVFTMMPFGRFMLNTVLIVQLNIIGNLVSCSIVAFAFARLKARGKNVMFYLVLSTMMLPFQVTLIPQFVLFRELKWIDTFLPLVVPGFFANAYQVFLLRNSFKAFPKTSMMPPRLTGRASSASSGTSSCR